MKKVIEVVMLAVLCACNVSCKKTLAKEEYAKYVLDRNNGLNKTVIAGEWEYCVQYKPYDYILLLEQGPFSEREKRSKELEGTAWFNISFMNRASRESALRYGLKSKDEYDKRLNYFLNEAADNVVLIYGLSDTLTPVGYAFENNYNLTPQETMIVGFKLPEGEKKPAKDMQIVYDDKVYKSGVIKAKIVKKAIDNAPVLSL